MGDEKKLYCAYDKDRECNSLCVACCGERIGCEVVYQCRRGKFTVFIKK